MENDYYISSAYLKLVLQSDPTAIAAVVKAVGGELAEYAEADYVPGRLVNRLYEDFAQRGVESWISNFGSQLGVGSHGPLSFAVLSAPDLGAALSALSEFLIIRTSGFTTEIREADNRIELILKDRTNHDFAGRWLIESGFLVIQNLIETITLHPPGDNANLSFAFDKPKNHRELEQLFKLPCQYEQTENCLSIPKSWAQISSPLSDPEAFHSNIAKCRELKLQLSAESKDVFNLVQARLLSHFERRLSNQTRSDTIPSIESLANELYMSPRTLIRKLQTRGSSYKQILKDIRLEQAQYLLKNTHFTAAEIANKLGYRDAANFGRAFKAWVGESPTQWRRGDS